MRVIEVVPYSSSWAELYRAEKNAVEEALGSGTVTLHHIGSTAVAGLAAKPIIDLLLEVDQLQWLDGQAQRFARMGYESLGEYGIPGRRYYQKGGDQRTFQLHAFVRGSEHVVRHLAFRDYLREHAKVCAEYQRVKRAAAAACDNDIDRYCQAKDGFVKHHEALALKWYQRASGENAASTKNTDRV